MRQTSLGTPRQRGTGSNILSIRPTPKYHVLAGQWRRVHVATAVNRVGTHDSLSPDLTAVAPQNSCKGAIVL